jgi:hypothetical protein
MTSPRIDRTDPSLLRFPPPKLEPQRPTTPKLENSPYNAHKPLKPLTEITTDFFFKLKGIARNSPELMSDDEDRKFQQLNASPGPGEISSLAIDDSEKNCSETSYGKVVEEPIDDRRIAKKILRFLNSYRSPSQPQTRVSTPPLSPSPSPSPSPGLRANSPNLERIVNQCGLLQERLEILTEEIDTLRAQYNDSRTDDPTEEEQEVVANLVDTVDRLLLLTRAHKALQALRAKRDSYS